jgi:hypothetical protein
MQAKKSLSCDQLVGFALPIEAVGAPVDMWFLKCNLGNINTAGTWLPIAFTALIIVIFIPLSPDVTLSITLFLSTKSFGRNMNF